MQRGKNVAQAWTTHTQTVRHIAWAWQYTFVNDLSMIVPSCLFTGSADNDRTLCRPAAHAN